MAAQNQKIKILYLMKILMERTDEKHIMNAQELCDALKSYGVSAERKSIYADIQALQDFGMDVIQLKGSNSGYYIGGRDFELPELKLLVDAVQSSKFITTKKSEELIQKLEGLSSKHHAKYLQRQVYIYNRAKTGNETIYYNVDQIHESLYKNAQITFQYAEWTVQKELRLKKEGALYKVSPWALTWDDEYYYLVAFDHYEEKIKHYRVDKMANISILDERRGGKELFASFDVAAYSNVNFGMYHGNVRKVHISFPNYMVGVFIDRFGTDISIRPAGESRSEIAVDVAISKQFFGWIASLGRWVKIESPDDVVEEMRDFARKLANVYEENV